MKLSKMVFPWAILTFSCVLYSLLWDYFYPKPFPLNELYLWFPAIAFYLEFLAYKWLSTEGIGESPEAWFQNSVKTSSGFHHYNLRSSNTPSNIVQNHVYPVMLKYLHLLEKVAYNVLHHLKL